MANALQLLNLSNILFIAFPNISYPFDEFNFPVNIIIFSFFGNLLNGLMDGYKTSQLFLYLKGSPSKNFLQPKLF